MVQNNYIIIHVLLCIVNVTLCYMGVDILCMSYRVGCTSSKVHNVALSSLLPTVKASYRNLASSFK